MKLILAFALVLLTLGCASVVGPPPIDTSQLVAAGFKPVDLETPKQLERLQQLPPGKLTEWQNTGKHYFVYPDAAKKQLYVGRPAEYQAYLKLSGGTAGPSLAQQSGADMANYAKQDAGMSMLTARDADDPYWWSLDNIGWR
jgi:hypothetical protein